MDFGQSSQMTLEMPGLDFRVLGFNSLLHFPFDCLLSPQYLDAATHMGDPGRGLAPPKVSTYPVSALGALRVYRRTEADSL